MSEKRYAMAVDTQRCVGCQACVLACKAENQLPENGFRDWLVFETNGKFPELRMEIRSERCHHCENAPCVTACPTSALSYDVDAFQRTVDEDLCTSCKICNEACIDNGRGGCITFHPKKGTAQICDLCDGDPECVKNCFYGALEFKQPATVVSHRSRAFAQKLKSSFSEEATS